MDRPAKSGARGTAGAQRPVVAAPPPPDPEKVARQQQRIQRAANAGSTQALSTSRRVTTVDNSRMGRQSPGTPDLIDLPPDSEEAILARSGANGPTQTVNVRKVDTVAPGSNGNGNTPVRNPAPFNPKESVVKDWSGGPWSSQYLIYNTASHADEFPSWGSAPWYRDRLLRQFWPKEPMFASGLAGIASKYTSFGWTIKGPPDHAEIVKNMLNGCENGAGFIPLMFKTIIDLLTQDNGAFVEIIRTEDDPAAPVVTLNHLDSGRCLRTGNRFAPVYFQDIRGSYHEMKWYQVMALTECPSPVTEARGMQYSCLTRMLRAAQIARDIGIFMQEKVSGQFTRGVHMVGGVSQAAMDDAMSRQRFLNEQSGMVRYTQPLIVAGLDPTARISKETLDMAAMPDGFKYEEYMHWYIIQMALAFGADYLDFAPLTRAGLGGTASQANVLNQKSRGKGAALFMRLIEQAFNYHGVMPQTCLFSFGEQDTVANMELEELRKSQAQTIQILVMAGLITEDIGRMLMHENGMLNDELFNALMNDPDRPISPPQKFPGGPDVTAGDSGGAPGAGGQATARDGSGPVSPAGGHRPPSTQTRLDATGRSSTGNNGAKGTGGQRHVGGKGLSGAQADSVRADLDSAWQDEADLWLSEIVLRQAGVDFATKAEDSELVPDEDVIHVHVPRPNIQVAAPKVEVAAAQVHVPKPTVVHAPAPIVTGPKVEVAPPAVHVTVDTSGIERVVANLNQRFDGLFQAVTKSVEPKRRTARRAEDGTWAIEEINK